MSVSCTFHRSETAHFQCHECDSAFCDKCVSVRETNFFSGRNTNYFCPGCNVEVEMLSLGNIIKPFWNNLPSIFLYPFQLTPMILMSMLAAIGALSAGNSLVELIVWVVMMKYAYAALIKTGQGGLNAPVVTLALVNDDVLSVFKLFVLYGAVISGGLFVFSKTGTIGGFAYMAIILLALPAIVMLLVATNSLLHAMNPLLFVGIILRIGWPYFLMYLFLSFILGGPAALFSYLPSDILPLKVVLFIQSFFGNVYTIICFHLMGYVLLQYHKEIGYPVDYDLFMQSRGLKKRRKKLTPEQEVQKSLAVLVKVGKYSEAIKLVQPHLMVDEPNIELSEKFLQLLKIGGEDDKASLYVVYHFELLVKNNKKGKATALFREVKKGGGRLPDGDGVIKVAAWYLEKNEFKEAIGAYVYFIKHFKKHPLQPEAYLGLAKLLHEKANNTTKAKQILQAILKAYPQHHLASEAQEYLALVA